MTEQPHAPGYGLYNTERIRNMLLNIKISGALLIMLCAVNVTVSACTGVYVGKGVSSDGSIIIARTEDMESSESKRFIVHPAADHAPGERYTDAYGLSVEYPSHTYRYTAVPGSGERGIGSAPFGEAGFNELGVAATATITAYPNDAAIAADPFTKNGLYELSAADIILSRAKTAREGIEIIADIVNRYGSGEGNIIMTADKTEAWYMEIYTGHQYAAIKLPDDKAAVIPNTFMLDDIDLDSNDTIKSEQLTSLPEEKGFLSETNGKINLRKTYSIEEKEQNSIRIWGGHKMLRDNVWKDPYEKDHPLLFSPKQKISVKDVMNTFRYRYEDTEYSLDKPENKYVRAIGTSRQEECNILQIRPNMDTATGCIEWLCLGNCEFAPFVPYYAAALTDTPIMCKIDAFLYNERSAYWNSRGLSVICALNRELYGNKVKEFFGRYENSLIADVTNADRQMTAASDKTAMANKLCYDYTYDVFGKQRKMYRNVMKFLAQYEGEDEFEDNEYTFKIDLTAQKDSFSAHTTGLSPIITIN